MPPTSPDVPHMTPEEFRRLGHEMVDFLADYHARVGSLPVQSRLTPGQLTSQLPPHAPERGEEWSSILADIDPLVISGLTHWQSPSFFAYFPANGSYPAILGDLLSTGLGVNGMLWATSPAATELETRVLDWLAEMIGLPDQFLSGAQNGGGVIQSTASEATLVALVAARARALKLHAPRAATTDLASRLVLYTSTQAHSSVIKAAMIAGLAAHPEDRRRVRLIETDEHFAMNPEALAAAMVGDVDAGLVPFFVCATVGTTSSTAVDPLDRIGEVCATHDDQPWLHVDAAMAGAACLCPEYRWLLKGVEHAHTVSFNPHKWMLTNFDCTALWTRDRASIINALSVTPEYLRNEASSRGQVIDYRDWQIPLGRRFRALKLWFVIRHYGVQGLQAYIRGHMRQAELFEQLVRADHRFEVVTPRTITLTCFRLRPCPGDGVGQTNARNKSLLAAINATGKVYLSHTVLRIGGEDAYILRMALGGAATQEEHVRAAWAVIQDHASPR